jgi:hypothetical protein
MRGPVLVASPPGVGSSRDGRRGAPFDLVSVKLAAPSARPGTVAKADAIARLCASSLPFATLLAPAGYGKTTLLAKWAEADRRPFAWVALDGETTTRSCSCATSRPPFTASSRSHPRCSRRCSSRTTTARSRSTSWVDAPASEGWHRCRPRPGRRHPHGRPVPRRRCPRRRRRRRRHRPVLPQGTEDDRRGCRPNRQRTRRSHAAVGVLTWDSETQAARLSRPSWKFVTAVPV